MEFLHNLTWHKRKQCTNSKMEFVLFASHCHRIHHAFCSNFMAYNTQRITVNWRAIFLSVLLKLFSFNLILIVFIFLHFWATKSHVPNGFEPIFFYISLINWRNFVECIFLAPVFRILVSLIYSTRIIQRQWNFYYFRIDYLLKND